MFVTRSQLLVRPVDVPALDDDELDELDEPGALAPSASLREHATVAYEATITSVKSFASMKRSLDLELNMIATLYLLLPAVASSDARRAKRDQALGCSAIRVRASALANHARKRAARSPVRLREHRHAASIDGGQH
jgi:hypothetical protein